MPSIDTFSITCEGILPSRVHKVVTWLSCDCHRLSERCKAHQQMDREAGMQFIESLAELLRRLLDYRTVQQGDRNLHMHVMFNLLVSVFTILCLIMVSNV